MPAYEIPTYVRGTLVTDTVQFTNLAGAAADPTTVTTRVYSPATGQITAYVYPASQITRNSLGNFSVNVDTTPGNGRYVVRWEGSGAGSVQAAVEDVFLVASSL